MRKEVLDSLWEIRTCCYCLYISTLSLQRRMIIYKSFQELSYSESSLPASSQARILTPTSQVQHFSGVHMEFFTRKYQSKYALSELIRWETWMSSISPSETSIPTSSRSSRIIDSERSSLHSACPAGSPYHPSRYQVFYLFIKRSCPSTFSMSA